MKPIFSIYPDFYCDDFDCMMMHCDHVVMPDGSGWRPWVPGAAVCEICWVKYRRERHMPEETHEPTGPKEWTWH